MLIDSLMNSALDIKFLNLSLSDVLWETQLFFEFSQNDGVRISFILSPVPWSILFLLKSLNLVKSSLDIHYVVRDSIEMRVIWIIIGSIDVIIIFAVPGDVHQWVFQLSNVFVGILIAFSFALGVARFLNFFDFSWVLLLPKLFDEGFFGGRLAFVKLLGGGLGDCFERLS